MANPCMTPLWWGYVVVEVGKEQGIVINILSEPYRMETSQFSREDIEKANNIWPL